MGPRGRRGEPEVPPKILLSPHPVLTLSPGRRGGAKAQSALGWYRPSVGVPETLVALSLDLGCLLVIVMVWVRDPRARNPLRLAHSSSQLSQACGDTEPGY